MLQRGARSGTDDSVCRLRIDASFELRSRSSLSFVLSAFDWADMCSESASRHGVQTGSIADSSDRLHGCHSPTWIRRIGGTVVLPRARLRPQIQGATRFRSVSEDESRAGKLPNSTRGESGSPARSMRLRFRESFGSTCYRSVFMATTSAARTRRCARASSSRRARARFVGPRPAPRTRRRRSP